MHAITNSARRLPATHVPCHSLSSDPIPDSISAVPQASHGIGASLRILILKADRFYAGLIQTIIQSTAIAATTIAVASGAEANARITESPVDVLITDVIAADGDVSEWLPIWTAERDLVRRVFVTTRYSEPGILHVLSRFTIDGIFDESADTVDRFVEAVRAVIGGTHYWSDNVAAALLRQRSPSSVFRQLSATERMVLSVVGDGCDNATAAEILPLTESSIRSVRSSLHRKLGVQHKGELAAYAEENGFVVRTPFGVLRPGLATLIRHQKTRDPITPCRPDSVRSGHDSGAA